MDTPLSVVVCVPDGSLSASVAPCPTSPVAAPQTVSAVLLSSADYGNLLSYAGPIDQAEGYNLAETCAGTVIALYLLCLCIGAIIRLVRDA